MNSFKTLEREQDAIHPPTDASKLHKLHELIAPHLDSFNAIKEIPGARKGLLDLAVADIEKREAKDSFGNRLQRKPQ